MKQLLNWFRRGSLERGLDRELQYHMDRRVGDLMRSGLAGAGGPQAGQRWNSAASRRFGRKCATSG